METRAKQDLTRLGASIDLLKRQLHEWKTLLENQKQARQWIGEKPTSLANYTGSIGMFSAEMQQWSRLSLLASRQSEERQRLHLRHQREVAELDWVLAAHQPGLANR